MKSLLSILLATAVCLGLLAKLVPASTSCVEVVEHCHDEHHSHDAAGDHDHHHPCPDENSCPVDGHHHHHHGPCFGGFHLTNGEMAALLLAPPPATFLDYETLHLRPPTGPIADLDKPPLI